MSDFQLPLSPEINYSLSFDGNAAISETLDLEPLEGLASLRTRSWQYELLKRLLDACGAFVLLGICLIPCLIIGTLLAATSDEPIFYREWRVGRGGRPFRIWKFRTMRSCAPSHSHLNKGSGNSTLLQWRVAKDCVDPRITPVGRFLRKWSLDELPQLINVLRGEMSLVGPRPVVSAEIPLYGPLCHYYYAAAPGLSGLWQVSGRSNISYPARVALDVHYVQNWSLRADCWILWKTIPAVFRQTGAR